VADAAELPSRRAVLGRAARRAVGSGSAFLGGPAARAKR
jgi:hypothetical protein